MKTPTPIQEYTYIIFEILFFQEENFKFRFDVINETNIKA